MMSREELINTPCWTCWWKEGGRCYNEIIASIETVNGLRQGQEITDDLIGICDAACGYKSKRAFLQSVFGGTELVITSELAPDFRK